MHTTKRPRRMSGNSFLITQSLLSSWQWALSSGDMEEFNAVLRRQNKPQTRAMLDGIRFENILEAAIRGAEIPEDHEWRKPIRQLARYLSNTQYQVKVSKQLIVNGVPFTCYGIFDFLKAGIIYDTKFSKTYHVGKYLDSPQHPMYFYLCPEAYEFQYLICDGKYVYRESYRPDDIAPISVTIGKFMDWMDKANLVDVYCENWISRY